MSGIYPDLLPQEVNAAGDAHSKTHQRHDGVEVCKECHQRFPCVTLLLAYEWIQHRIRMEHAELERLRRSDD